MIMVHIETDLSLSTHTHCKKNKNKEVFHLDTKTDFGFMFSGFPQKNILKPLSTL